MHKGGKIPLAQVVRYVLGQVLPEGEEHVGEAENAQCDKGHKRADHGHVVDHGVGVGVRIRGIRERQGHIPHNKRNRGQNGPSGDCREGPDTKEDFVAEAEVLKELGKGHLGDLLRLVVLDATDIGCR